MEGGEYKYEFNKEFYQLLNFFSQKLYYKKMYCMKRMFESEEENEFLYDRNIEEDEHYMDYFEKNRRKKYKQNSWYNVSEIIDEIISLVNYLIGDHVMNVKGEMSLSTCIKLLKPKLNYYISHPQVTNDQIAFMSGMLGLLQQLKSMPEYKQIQF